MYQIPVRSMEGLNMSGGDLGLPWTVEGGSALARVGQPGPDS